MNLSRDVGTPLATLRCAKKLKYIGIHPVNFALVHYGKIGYNAVHEGINLNLLCQFNCWSFYSLTTINAGIVRQLIGFDTSAQVLI